MNTDHITTLNTGAARPAKPALIEINVAASTRFSREERRGWRKRRMTRAVRAQAVRAD